MEPYRLWFTVGLAPAVLALESGCGENPYTKNKQQQQQHSSVSHGCSAKTSRAAEQKVETAEAADAAAISTQRSVHQQQQGKQGQQQRPRDEKRQQRGQEEQQLLRNIARARMSRCSDKRSCWRHPDPGKSKISLHRTRLTRAPYDCEPDNLIYGTSLSALPALKFLRTICTNHAIVASSKKVREARNPGDNFVYSSVNGNAQTISAVSRVDNGVVPIRVAGASRGRADCTPSGSTTAPTTPHLPPANMRSLPFATASAPRDNIALAAAGGGATPAVGLSTTVPGDCATCNCSWCRCCCWRRYKIVAEMDRKKAHQEQNTARGHGNAVGTAHADIAAMADVASIMLPLMSRGSRHLEQVLVILEAITNAVSMRGDCLNSTNSSRY